MIDNIFLDYDQAVTCTQGTNLPHWDQHGKLQFVTFRLADSIPSSLLEQMREEKSKWELEHPEPWNQLEKREYNRLFDDRFNHWLDQGYGSQMLKEPQFREPIEETILYGQGTRYLTHSFVIMPTHVHVLFHPINNESASKIINTWKSISARRINQMRHHEGPIWMKESFDRMIRSYNHYRHVQAYIYNNPKSLAPSQFTYRLLNYLIE